MPYHITTESHDPVWCATRKDGRQFLQQLKRLDIAALSESEPNFYKATCYPLPCGGYEIILRGRLLRRRQLLKQPRNSTPASNHRILPRVTNLH